MTRVIVWLWDAAGPDRCASGVTIDPTSAKKAAGACLTGGQASTALVQAAELVAGPDVLDPYYARFGYCWQARRTKNGAIRWHPSPQPAIEQPAPANDTRRIQ